MFSVCNLTKVMNLLDGNDKIEKIELLKRDTYN